MEVGVWRLIALPSKRICTTLEGPQLLPACLPQVTHGKPAPDLFLAAAGLLGVPPESCVAIEDAASGAEVSLRGRIRGRRAAKVGVLV